MGRGVCIVEDSRQQALRHELKHKGWASMGVPVLRCKLPFGDYAYPPRVSVDTKRNIQELYMDLTQEHERFREECKLAQEFGCLLVVLVENTDGVTDLATLSEWIEPMESYQARRRHGAKRRMGGKRLATSCATMTKKYGVVFDFCKPGDAANRVLEWLEVREGERGRVEPREEVGLVDIPAKASQQGTGNEERA